MKQSGQQALNQVGLCGQAAGRTHNGKAPRRMYNTLKTEKEPNRKYGRNRGREIRLYRINHEKVMMTGIIFTFAMVVITVNSVTGTAGFCGNLSA